jgi:hypothetical protein
MKTIKLTKPYIIEGRILNEGTELVIASDGEVETVNATANKPTENEIDFGLVDEKEETSTTEESTDEEEKKSK